MRSFVGRGESYDASAGDLAAFDAVGWDLANAIPEPPSYGLRLLGLAAVTGAAKRRRATT